MSATEFPELAAEHLHDARLHATRHDLVRALGVPPGGRIAEIGVALGEFTRFMIDTLRPAEFHAFDLFLLHHDAMLWGQPTSKVLQGKRHIDYYRDKMSQLGTPVVIHEGRSQDTLRAIPERSFDLVYVDGAHDYDGVRHDAAEAARTLRDGGVLIFNDYILHDPFIHSDYGIVQVVNEMVVEQGWAVVGFALQRHMFCDIAIRRR